MGPPFPFIVSAGRSGTTLLQAMLSAHPEMSIPPEAQFLLPVGDEVRRRPRGVDPDDVVARWAPRGSFQRWGLAPDELREAIRRARPRTYPDAVRALYAFHARAHGKRRYGDKTPKHVMSMPTLGELFPEARFIHLVRDGRDVTCSYVTRGLGPRDTVEGAVWWEAHVTRGRRDGLDLGPERYLELQYEDLVADVEGTLRVVCAFVELRYEPAMLSYREGVEGLLPERQLRELHEGLFHPVEGGMRDWRTEMQPDDVAVFEALAGDLLSDLGYPRAVPEPSVGLRLRARAQRAAVRARWAGRSLGRSVRLRSRAGDDGDDRRAAATGDYPTERSPAP